MSFVHLLASTGNQECQLSALGYLLLMSWHSAGVSFFSALAESGNFTGANMTLADLESGNFEDADFTNAVLAGAFVNNAQFKVWRNGESAPEGFLCMRFLICVHV
eukprot:GHRQ01035513.1.p3 GENE.GHRQ01035513.1~~GHRQ01035513.1.p3  ORF type:complete len:105 (-),score=13.79 GHRQ01035513.1:971-1285(-)